MQSNSKPSSVSTNAEQQQFISGLLVGVSASAIAASLAYLFVIRHKLNGNDVKSLNNDSTIAPKNVSESSTITKKPAKETTVPATAAAASSVKRTRVFRLGTRSSDLAMVQTRWVKEHLERMFPDLLVEIKEGVNARGDIVLDQSLKRLATQDPGIFTKELEGGLLENQYDAVVHSLKDMPTRLPEGLVLAAVTEREDPRDALVIRSDIRSLYNKHRENNEITSSDLLAKLPKGSIIGTSSVRREAFIKQGYPHLIVKIIRGNVNTRLAKLDRGEFDAIVLAAAGLKRLGPSFEDRIDEYLEPPHFYYGVSQGALGLQCRENDAESIKILQALQHSSTAYRCHAERALLRRLEGGCQVPLGVSTEFKEVDHDGKEILELHCVILSETGNVSISGSARESLKDVEDKIIAAQNMGKSLGEKLLKVGAGNLIESKSEKPRENVYGSAENPNLEARSQPGSN